MLTKSCKAKGRALQNWTKEKLIDIEPGLDKDITCAIMGEKGGDIKLSPMARVYFPFQFECKNLAKFVGYKYYKQAKEHGSYTPVVVIKANKEEPLVIIKATDFFYLIRE